MEQSTTPTTNVENGNDASTTLPPATHHNIRYAILSAQQVQLLRHRLEAELPYSLPLLRRLEFEDVHPSGKDAKVFVTTAVDEHAAGEDQDQDRSWLDAWLMNHTQTNTSSSSSSSSSPPPPPPWLAAHIDLANQGQTQVFLYSSWSNPASGEFTTALRKEGARFLDGSLLFEDSKSCPSPSPSTTTTTSISSSPSSPSSHLHPHLICTLFTYIHQTLIPLLPSTPSSDWLELKRTGKYLSTPYDRSKVIFGSIHESISPYFLAYSFAITRTDTGYWKYIFAVTRSRSGSKMVSDTPNTTTTQTQPQQTTTTTTTTTTTSSSTSIHIENPIFPPPKDYHISNLTPTHLQIALDRTPIPRTLTTLEQFTSAGIFHLDEPNPVSWGFLAKDQSISSLHTEDEHRGKGLAGYVARELLRRAAAVVGKNKDEEGGGGGGEEYERERERKVNDTIYYGHADVSESNVGSRSVMEKLGGVPMWKTAWMEVNLRDVIERSGNENGQEGGKDG
ncbi:hypothetical protein B0A52_07613 [Exophiala mesophila]|uniref:N-acetyltransferase domain-containing protein n=1 Tax=Exophiala mesophila TaxID=212818 RepID=A0A438MYB1_EXOME|nr:hypothetical protein B0A52_07613 [Exophiala mesophila]